MKRNLPELGHHPDQSFSAIKIVITVVISKVLRIKVIDTEWTFWELLELIDERKVGDEVLLKVFIIIQSLGSVEFDDQAAHM